MTNTDIIKKLNNLIVMLKDADEGFHTAAQEVRDTSLRTQLHNMGQRSATLWGELQNEVRVLGGHPEEDGTFTGKCRRIWMEVKTAFTDKDETVVLKDCVRAQESVQQEFHDTINCVTMPGNIKSVLNRHYEEVRSIADKVKERHAYYSNIQTAS